MVPFCEAEWLVKDEEMSWGTAGKNNLVWGSSTQGQLSALSLHSHSINTSPAPDEGRDLGIVYCTRYLEDAWLLLPAKGRAGGSGLGVQNEPLQPRTLNFIMTVLKCLVFQLMWLRFLFPVLEKCILECIFVSSMILVWIKWTFQALPFSPNGFNR